MTGTRPRAFAAYCPYKIEREILLRKDTSLDVSDRSAGGLSAGHPNQLKIVSSRDKMPSPNQVSLSPSRSSSGIRVPDAAIPRPRPRKIIPLTNPRLAAGILRKDQRRNEDHNHAAGKSGRESPDKEPHHR